MQQKSGIFGHQSHFPPSFTTSSSPVYTFSLLLLSVQLFLMDEGNGERKRNGGKKDISPLLLFPPSESARMAFGEKGVEGEGERERRKHYWQIVGDGGEEKRRGKGFGWWVLALFSLFLSLFSLPSHATIAGRWRFGLYQLGPLFGAKRNSGMKKGDGIILVLCQNPTGTRNTPLSAIEFF